MQRFGMSFQSHSRDHVYLTRLSSHEVVVQLTRSKLILQDRLGLSVDFLAAPYGDLNQGVLRAASEAGYHAVCSSHNWPALQGSRVIPRVALYRKTSLAGFRHLLEKHPFVYGARAVREMLLYGPKQLYLRLGPRRIERPCLGESTR